MANLESLAGRDVGNVDERRARSQIAVVPQEVKQLQRDFPTRTSASNPRRNRGGLRLLGF